MVASVIEELSPKDERTKLLREKLTIIHEAQVSAVSAGFAVVSNLQLLRCDALLRNFNFQPPVLSAVRTAPFEGHHVVGPEPKVLQARVQAIRQADCMTGSSVTFAKQKEVKTSTKTSSKKTAPRPSVFDRLGSPPSTMQRTVTQESSFWAGAGRACPRPFQGSKKSGKSSSSSAAKKHWWVPGGDSPGRLCPALAESAGQLPGHRHRRGRGGHCISATISAHPSKHQFPDQEQPTGPSASRRSLADEGSHRACHQSEVPGFLQSVVSGTQEDRRSATCDRPVHSQPPHGSSTLQDGDARVRPISYQKSGVDGSIDIRDAYLHVPMHQAVRKYLRFVVNKKVYQFTCLPFGLATSPREFTKLLRPVVLLLRQQGVKLHVYLDDWLIRADTPEEAQLHAQTTIKVLQFLRWIINFEKSDLTPSQDFQFIGMQFNTQRFTVAPLPKMRVKVQSVHQHWMANPNITARDLHRLLGMLVFMALLVRRGRLRLHPVQWWAATAWCQRTGNWSDWIQVPQWVLSEVAWWSSPAVLQGLPLATRETEVTLFTDASSSGWGAQLGSRSTQWQWSASQRSCHINVLEMQAVIYAVRDFLPHQVPSSATDVRQRSDGGVHQERGGHKIAHFDADDHPAAQVVRQQSDFVGSRPSARSAQHPGGFLVQSRPDTDHGVDDGHGESTTRVCQVGRTTDRYVCDIRQQTTRQVHIAISGPQGGVDRCHVHALGQGEGPLVRLPAIQDGPASSAEDRSITRSAGYTDRSTATGSIMVPRADGPIPRRPGSPVRGRSRPADTRRVHGRGRDRDSSIPAVKSSRVETLRAILRAKGHSREAANMMSRCLRESSQQVYESHWSRFVVFCRTKRWHVFRVRSHQFSTYMMHLFRDGLLPSTIISHHTSVASVLRHWVYDPAADPHIKLLVRAFRLERPVQRRIMPKWDL